MCLPDNRQAELGFASMICWSRELGFCMRGRNNEVFPEFDDK